MADFFLDVRIDAQASYSKIQDDIKDLEALINGNPPKIKLGIELNNGATAQLSSQLKAIDNSVSGKSSTEIKILSENSKEYLNALKQVQTTIDQVTNSQNKWTAAQHGKSSEAYKDLGVYKTELINLQEKLINGGISQDKFNKKLTELRAGVSAASGVIKRAGEDTRTWTQRIGSLGAKFGTWLSITQVIMEAVKTVKKMVASIIELDTAMTELKKVTNETDQIYERVLTDAVSRAKELGASMTDVVTATADFARLGFGVEDAEKLADVAIIYKNVGDGIEDINTASESVIATMQAFDIKANESMSIVDKFNEVGNNFAITSAGVGDALLRSAAAMKSANNTLDETIALTAAANTIVQDPDKVGTTLKTVSMFLRAAKTDAEEAGESTDGMANSVSELRKEILALTGNKVDIQLNENEFKSTYQILKELSVVWKDLTDLSQANILELVGGKRNSNVVSALLENFSVAEKALASSMDSAGSATKENEKYLESIQGRLDLMKASFEELSQNFIDGELVKSIVDAGTSLINLLNIFAKVINVGDGAILKITALIASFYGVAKAVDTISAPSGLLTKFLNLIDPKLSNGIGAFILSMGNGQGVVKSFSNAIEHAFGSVGLLTVKLAALTAVLYAAYKVWDYFTVTSAEAAEAVKKTTEELEGTESELQTAEQRLSEVQKSINELNNVEKLSLTEKADLENLRLENVELQAQIQLLKAKKAVQEEEKKKAEDEAWKVANGNAFAIGTNAYRTDGKKANIFDQIIDTSAVSKGRESTLMNEVEAADAYIARLNEIEKEKEALADKGIEENAQEWIDLNEEAKIYRSSLVEIAESLENTGEQGQTKIREITYGLSDSTEKLQLLKDELTDIPDELIEIANMANSMQEGFGDGNVDLTIRPQVEVDGGYQTVFTTSLTEWVGDEETGHYAEIHVTPILPDGTVLDDKSLEEYVREITKDGNILENDDKGIVLKVTDLSHLDDSDVKNQTDAYKEAIKTSEEWAEQLHIEQEIYYETIGSVEEYASKIKEANKNSVYFATATKDMTDEEVVRWFNQYVAEVENLEKEFRSAESAVSNFSKTMSALKNTEEAIKPLSKAYKELYKDGRVAFDTLAEIQKNFGDVDGIEEYITTLAAANTNTVETARAFDALLEKAMEEKLGMESLADANVDLVASMLDTVGVANSTEKAEELITKARINNKYSTLDSADAISKQISNLEDEAKQSGLTKNALIDLVSSCIVFNNTNLDVSQKIEALQALATQAGLTNSMLYGGLYESYLKDAENSGKYRTGAEAEAAALAQLRKKFMSDLGYNPNSTTTWTNPDDKGEDKVLKAWDELVNEKKHLVEMDKMTQEEYYDWLASAYKSHLSDTQKYSDEIRSIEEELYNWEKERYKIAYDEERKNLDHRKAMDLMTEEQYFIELTALYNKYYKNNDLYTDEAMEAEEELYDLRVELIEKWSQAAMDAINEIAEATEGTVEAIKQLIDDSISTHEENFDYEKGLLDHALAMNYITEEEYYGSLEKLYKSYFKDKTLYTEQYWENQEEVYQHEQAMLEDSASAIEDIHAKVVDMIKKELEDAIDAIEETREKYLDLIEIRREALSDLKDEEDYEKERTEQLSTISELQRQLNALSHDTSAVGVAKYKEVYAELQEAQKALEEMEKNRAFDVMNDQLDDEEKSIDVKFNTQISEYENLADNNEYLVEEAWARLNDKNADLYNSLIEYNKKYSTSIKDDITGSWKTATKALEDYTSAKAGYESINGQIGQSGMSSSEYEKFQKITTGKKVYGWVSTALNFGASMLEIGSGLLSGMMGLAGGLIGGPIGSFLSLGGGLVGAFSGLGSSVLKVLGGFASGTNHVPKTGWYRTNELGDEINLVKDSSGNEYRLLTEGSHVVDAESTSRLMNIINNPSLLADWSKGGVLGSKSGAIGSIVDSSVKTVTLAPVFQINSSDPDGVVSEIRKMLPEITKHTMKSILNGAGNGGVKQKVQHLY